MKGLQTTCFILAVSILSVQSVRHFYVRFFETTASVLDKYDEEEIEKEIEEAELLDQLVAKYDPAKKRKDELEALMEEEAKKKPEKEREAFRNEFQEDHIEDYRRAWILKSAILDWESKSKEIRELRIFWAFGFGLFVVGCIVYLWSSWLGMAILLPGATEMIWWTSPDLNLSGTVQEFERLLNNKLIFTIITIILLVAVWVISGYLERHKVKQETL